MSDDKGLETGAGYREPEPGTTTEEEERKELALQSALHGRKSPEVSPEKIPKLNVPGMKSDEEDVYEEAVDPTETVHVKPLGKLSKPQVPDLSKFTSNSQTQPTVVPKKTYLSPIRRAAQEAQRRAAERLTRGETSFGMSGAGGAFGGPPLTTPVAKPFSQNDPFTLPHPNPTFAGWGSPNPPQNPRFGAPDTVSAWGMPSAGGAFGSAFPAAFPGSGAPPTHGFPGAFTHKPPAPPVPEGRPEEAREDPNDPKFRFFNMTEHERGRWLEGAKGETKLSHKWSEIQAIRLGVCTGAVVEEVRNYIYELRAASERIPASSKDYESIYIDDLVNRTARDHLAHAYDRIVKILAPFDSRAYSVAALINALSMEFLGVAEVEALRSELRRITQGGSTVAEYSRRFLSYQKQAYEAPTALEREEITQLFLFGLRSEKMRNKIHDKGVRDNLYLAVQYAVQYASEDAVKEALKLKYGKNSSQQQQGKKKGNSQNPEPMDTSSIDLAAFESLPIREKLAEHDRKYNAILRKLESVTMVPKGPETSEATSSEKKGGKGSNKRKANGQKKPNASQKPSHCYVCGETGHFSPRCPQRVEQPKTASTIASTDSGN